jgi:anaerobic selenocysteine-containing dehydrogenase
MTNHWIDYQHSDVIMNIGGNTVENHPISMKWIQKAKDKGGKLIVVDPRFTRTAAVADLYAPIRPGTNVAFFSGLINYAIENNKCHDRICENVHQRLQPDQSSIRLQRRIIHRASGCSKPGRRTDRVYQHRHLGIPKGCRRQYPEG